MIIGNYFTHNPSNVTYMQIVRSNSNRRLRTSITCQHNLPFYNKEGGNTLIIMGGLEQASPTNTIFLSITKKG
jgi:hypothetical protein